MTRNVPLAVSALAAIMLMTPVASHAIDELAAKERIGARAGGVATFDGLNDAYGGGWSLTIYFTEQLSRPWFLDVRLGAIYLGDLKIETLDDMLTNAAGIQGSMRMLYFSVGPMFGMPIGGGYAAYVSAGVGIYSASMVFNASTPTTPYRNFSDQYVGVNGAVGLTRRLSTNWSFEGNAAVHYFNAGKAIDDVYYAFTNGANDPLMLDIAVGFVIDIR